MANQEFQKGDIVKLKGQDHGPKMVVAHFKTNGELVCVWWNTSSQAFNEHHFWSHMLVKAQ